MDEIEWHEGMEVYTQHRGGWGGERPFVRDTIAKVYKSGRFILEGERSPKTQFRSETRFTVLDRLPYTDASKGYTWVYPVTPETTAHGKQIAIDVDIEKRLREAFEVVTRNTRIGSRHKDAKEVLELLESIVKILEPKEQPQ